MNMKNISKIAAMLLIGGSFCDTKAVTESLMTLR